MGGGIGGSIDQRTGAFQAQVPLVSVAGRAGTGLSLALSYDQSLAVLGEAGDRFGLGAGWTLGVPWVDTAGGVTGVPGVRRLVRLRHRLEDRAEGLSAAGPGIRAGSGKCRTGSMGTR